MCIQAIIDELCNAYFTFNVKSTLTSLWTLKQDSHEQALLLAPQLIHCDEATSSVIAVSFSNSDNMTRSSDHLLNSLNLSSFLSLVLLEEKLVLRGDKSPAE